jgi:hypothetical protein
VRNGWLDFIFPLLLDFANKSPRQSYNHVILSFISPYSCEQEELDKAQLSRKFNFPCEVNYYVCDKNDKCE